MSVSTLLRRSVPWISPVWMEVLTREPRAENTLPRRPIAAGTMMRSPGYWPRVSVIDPRIAPATRLVELLTPSATRL